MKPTFEDHCPRDIIEPFCLVVGAEFGCGVLVPSMFASDREKYMRTYEHLIGWCAYHAAIKDGRAKVVRLFRNGPTKIKNPDDLKLAAALELCRERLGWPE
jgi:hypothetical protein